MKYFDITDTEIWLDSIPITTLYLPLAKEYCLSEFVFFLIDDDWDEQSLIDLKDTTGASFLFGLQTTNKRIDKLDVIDSVIVCQPDEVQQVMKVFEVTSNRSGNLLTTDFNDLKKALQFTKPAHFIQATAMSANPLDRAEKAINKVLSQIPQDINIDFLILRVKTDSDISLEEYIVISNAFENRITDNTSMWYGSDIIDTPDCCWIEAVYMAK